MKRNNGLLYNFLAVHYRKSDDPLYFTRGFEKPPQGCWRGFRSWNEANEWLTRRCNIAPGSPQGKYIYVHIDQVLKELETNVNESLKAALLNFLEYQKQKNLT